MTNLATLLESIDRQLADVVSASDDARFETDAEVTAAVQTLGQIQRRLDGMIVAATDRIVERDQPLERSARLSSRLGCRDVAELLRRALRVDAPTARRYVTAASATHRETEITSGELLPGAFPELSAALADGELSVAGFLACTVPLQKAKRIGAADRLAADTLLGRFARGLDLDTDPDNQETHERGPAPTTDELAGLTAHIINRIDPDGAEPEDRAGQRRRHLTIGKLRGGTVPVRGELLPEVAAQLQKLVDSLTNPKIDSNNSDSNNSGSDSDSDNGRGLVHFRPSGDEGTGNGDGDGSNGDGDGDDGAADGDSIPPHRAAPPPHADAADLRTHAQKRHDAFATIVMTAAASGAMPTLGGAAPTLVVSVRADDYASRTGRATIEGSEYDVPLGTADHAACAGLVQRVLFDENGAIVSISTNGRIFNAHQRRAIALRDRKCLIPGCEIRAEWCEIHREHGSGPALMAGLTPRSIDAGSGMMGPPVLLAAV